MSTSRARLQGAACDGVTRILAAHAGAPQRWNLACGRTPGAWAEVTHQLLGDGVFGGDVHRTAIVADVGARLLVRSLAATPLRAPGASATVTRLHAATGSTLLYLPGALIPHRDADHASILRVEAAAGARVLAATVVVAGRTGMGERGAFRRIALRTVATFAGRLAFAEHAAIEPGRSPIDSVAAFNRTGAAVSIVCVGDWPPAEPGWWAAEATPGVCGGAAPLRLGGTCYRALSATLGDALAFLADIETRARNCAP